MAQGLWPMVGKFPPGSVAERCVLTVILSPQGIGCIDIHIHVHVNVPRECRVASFTARCTP